MRLLPLIAVPALVLVTLSGCVLAPRGPVVSEERSIGAASSVVLETSGDLTISEGEPSLVIRAPESVLDRLTSDVRGDELVLGVAPGTPGFVLGRISYELTLPSLVGLEIDGSGDVDSDVPGERLDVEINGSGELRLSGIDASSVTLAISGSGDVELAGRADELVISIDGSADVEADDLDSARVSVDIDGSGDVAVAASETLDVSISGAGSVEYAGDPAVTQDISGSGKISRR